MQVEDEFVRLHQEHIQAREAMIQYELTQFPRVDPETNTGILNVFREKKNKIYGQINSTFEDWSERMKP
ncbi:hypothetical protein ACFR95_05355 [Halolamina salifodinae]|uniref:hypothetical protein n=1 Tax=Halolamina salifodinae TaxID=1202767 RepID=UPI003630591C